MHDPAKPQLDYAPAPPMSRQRRAARRVLAWVAVGLLIVVAAVYGPAMWNQVWYLRGQRQCLTATVPAGQVAYSNDPAAATTLLAAGYHPVASAVGRSLVPMPAGVEGASMSAGYAPPALAAVGEETLGYYANLGWGYVRQGVSNAPRRTGAFLHGLRNASIGQRLVAVVFLERQDSAVGERRLEINALAWRLATWEAGSRLQLASLTTLVVPDIDHHHVRISGGQMDPANPAHFTMAYDVDGKSGTIDGYLDAYERVILQFRDGPGAGWIWSGPTAAQ